MPEGWEDENLNRFIKEILKTNSKIIDSKDFIEYIKKLDVKDGDVVIVKLSDNPKKGLEILMDQVKSILKDRKAGILLIPKEISIETMSEKEMNSIGWFKREDYRRLIRYE